MLFINGDVFCDTKFVKCDVRIKDDKIIEMGQHLKPLDNEKVSDISGKKLLPGLIDVHTHGRVGEDFTYSDCNGIHKMLLDYAMNGITSLLATTMTMDEDFSIKMLKRITEAMETPQPGSVILGVNLEGPFLGMDKKGCHDERYIKSVDINMFEEWDWYAKCNILMVDLDPLYADSLKFINKYKDKKIISIAHTSIGYDAACTAVDAGVFHVTHLFNAMNSLHHREPGILGMVYDKEVYAELITDGLHIHPSVVRMMFAMIPDKLCIISDSLSAAGCQDGEYELGGLSVYVKDGKAALSDGTLACSTISIYEGMLRCIRFGISEEQAILAATRNPARSIRMEDQIGSIREGLFSDLLVTDREYNLEQVFIRGYRIKNMN